MKRFCLLITALLLITSWGTAVVTDGDMWVHTTTFEEEPFDALLEKYS